METVRRCQQCGAWLPADAAGGLCPKCLVSAGTRDKSSAAILETVRISAAPASPASPSKAESSPSALDAGVRLGGYRIVRSLGQGGMGAVYEAEEIESGRRVALKVLGRALDSPEARKRFLREGRLAASVNHPNTVYVFGTDEIEGQPVITMELVRGGTLQERVEQSGPMPVTAAVDAILQVIAGLEAAAVLGVLHRDVKPSNCFVETDGTVKVGDFGLSISTSGGEETRLTMAGSFLGTPAFSSPEQLRGDEFTVQGDIYAVGVTLYYLLTGRTPFQCDDVVRMLATVLERPAPSPDQLRPELPKGLCRAVLRCLEKQPAERFKNYAALRNALLPYVSAAPTPATLSLRFLAALIDGVLLGLMSVAVTLLSGGHWDALINSEAYKGTQIFSTALSAVLMLIYFTALEGLWGASLGKRICRLRVVGPNRGLPGVPRALLRSALTELLPAIPTMLMLWFSVSQHQTAAKGKVQFKESPDGSGLILALLFVTARRRNGFAALQDLLTRTRVVREVSHAGRPGLEAAEAGLADPASMAAATQFGPYRVLESLGNSGADEMLLGFDTRLLRNVWIRKLPSGTPPLLSSLRNLARVGRLRWLNGRRSPGECWDAYEGPSGRPLADLIHKPQPWSRVRFWLLDLAEEMNAALKDNSLPETLELDWVWITADGRAKLLDFPAPATGAGWELAREPATDASAVGDVVTPQLFLNQVAVASLEGRCVSSPDARPASLAIPLPLHARELLGEMQAGLSPGVLAERLRPLLNKLAFVSRTRRLGTIAGFSVPSLAVLATIVAFGLATSRSMQTHSEVTALSQCLEQLMGVEKNRNLPSGLDGEGNAYSGNLLGPALTWNGTPFKFGPTNAADAVSAFGQTIPLPSGRFSNLAMLATGVEGNQTAQVLTVTYTDNTSAKWMQSFSDWYVPKNRSGESNVLAMAYRDLSRGTQDQRTFYVYGYAFPLDSNRTVRSLLLPTNSNLEVLASTLEPPATTVDLSAVFNRANGIVADGSTFTEDAHAREAFEIYITGRFRQTIKDPATWNSLAGALIPHEQRTAAEQLIATRKAPTDAELKSATVVVEPYLERMKARNAPTMSDAILIPTQLLNVCAFILLFFAGIPSLVTALLFRGGLLLRMLGLTVVKKDGARASRLRIFWRTLIAWSPALLLITLAIWLVPESRAPTRLQAEVIGFCFIVTAGLILWSSLLPERGLQDRLAGTCLVPRE